MALALLMSKSLIPSRSRMSFCRVWACEDFHFGKRLEINNPGNSPEKNPFIKFQPATSQSTTLCCFFFQFFFKLSWYCFLRLPKPISQRFHVHMLMPQSEFRLRSFQSKGKGLPRKVMTGYWNATSSSNHWTPWGVDIHGIPNIASLTSLTPHYDLSLVFLVRSCWEKNQTSSPGKSTTLTKDIFKYKALE